MSVTFGFYDSINHDRQYTAEDISRMFDGFFSDGVFQYYEEALAVTPGEGMTVNVGAGKAWFYSTWTQNDDIITLSLDAADETYDRIDAVVLKVDHNVNIRANDIFVKKGTPAANPVRPTLIRSESYAEMALSYVTVRANSTEIIEDDISDVRGSSETPWMKSVVNDIDEMIDSLREDIASSYKLDVIYPVGSIYISTFYQNPSTYLGGTWEAIKGRFLIGAGVKDGVTYLNGEKNGEYVHKLLPAELAVHSHTGSLTSDGAHSHQYDDTYSRLWPVKYRDASGSEDLINEIYYSYYEYRQGKTVESIQNVTATTAAHEHTHALTGTDTSGGNGGHNNLPPYLAVYIWKRTA